MPQRVNDERLAELQCARCGGWGKLLTNDSNPDSWIRCAACAGTGTRPGNGD
jgi:hypothetical protein